MNFKIYCPSQVQFAALHLTNQLRRLGHSAGIVNRINTNDGAIYIIYNAAAVERMPPRYIVYQTEVPGSPWYNDLYYTRIKNALAIWEYHPANVKAYEGYNRNIAIVPPGVNPQRPTRKDIPVLFYGHLLPGHRRTLLLQALSRQMPIRIISNKMGLEMWRLLSRAKVVLNIHFYPQANLELFRILECLSHQCHVVSEYCLTPEEAYRNVVHFSDSIQGMVELICELNLRPFRYDLSKLDNTEAIKVAIERI